MTPAAAAELITLIYEVNAGLPEVKRRGSGVAEPDRGARDGPSRRGRADGVLDLGQDAGVDFDGSY